MMRRITPHLASAMIAGVVLLGAVLYAGLSSPVTEHTGRLTFRGDPLVTLKATKPDIGAFEEFNVNDDDPFIPWQDRQVARAAKRPRQVKPQEPAPVVRPIQRQRPPPFKLPRKNAGTSEAPNAVGYVGSSSQAVVLVRAPDSQASVPVPVGGMINGWTLIAVEAGNQVVWEDAKGNRHAFPIGSEALNNAQPLAVASTPDGEVKPAQTVKPASAAPKQPPAANDPKRVRKSPGEKVRPEKPTPPDRM